MQRIQIDSIRKHPWFRKNYVPANFKEDVEVNLDDVRAVFEDIEVCPDMEGIVIIQYHFMVESNIFLPRCLKYHAQLKLQ